LTEETKGPPKDFDELKKKIDKKKKVDTQTVIKQIATREKLERDYREDILEVTFFSSPETQRMIKAKRPTQSEMMTIMRLSAEAAIYEGKMDTKSLQKMVDIYDKLPELAASLSIDKALNSTFWKEKVSFATLQNFITEVIKETQKGTGVPPEEMKTFR
jgi:hypothetical protein